MMEVQSPCYCACEHIYLLLHNADHYSSTDVTVLRRLLFWTWFDSRRFCSVTNILHHK